MSSPYSKTSVFIPRLYGFRCYNISHTPPTKSSILFDYYKGMDMIIIEMIEYIWMIYLVTVKNTLPAEKDPILALGEFLLEIE